MNAKYSRLSTEDPEVKFDFSSTHDFSSSHNFSSFNKFSTTGTEGDTYRSIFSYSNGDMQQRDLSVITGLKEFMMQQLVHNATAIMQQPDQYLRHPAKQSFGNRLCSVILTVACGILCVIFFPISACFSIKMVSEHERMVVFRLGRITGVKGPGIMFIIPLIDVVKKVDIRVRAFIVPPFQLITSDAGIVELGADVYYQISDAVRYVTAVQDLDASLRSLVRNMLLNKLMKYSLQDIERKGEEIVSQILMKCNTTANAWGAHVSKIGLTNNGWALQWAVKTSLFSPHSPIKVLQAAKSGGELPLGLRSQHGIAQLFQNVTQSLMFTGTNCGSQQQHVSDDVVGAVGSEDVSLSTIVTPRDLMHLVRSVLSDSLVRSVDAVYQFELSGKYGGVFFLDLKHGEGNAGEGPDPRHNPDVVFEMSVSDMQAMFQDKLKPLQAYMSGRLKVSGDLSAAMRLEEVLERVITKTNNSTVAGHTIVNI